MSKILDLDTPDKIKALIAKAKREGATSGNGMKLSTKMDIIIYICIFSLLFYFLYIGKSCLICLYIYIYIYIYIRLWN